MFDLGWDEIALIGLVAVMVLGPKELPKAMRAGAQMMRKARKMAGEFQGHWNDMVRESELEEVKNAVTRVATADVGGEVQKLMDPTGEFARELGETVSSTRSEIESATQLDPPPATPASAAPPAAQPTPAPQVPAPQVGAST